MVSTPHNVETITRIGSVSSSMVNEYLLNLFERTIDLADQRLNLGYLGCYVCQDMLPLRYRPHGILIDLCSN